VDRRRDREDPVIVTRKILRHAQALATASRATVPVRVSGKAAVERAHELFADHRHQVFGAIREVDL
jgi:hypothetical protein